jgi:phosphatidate cytidylyltransferase
MLLSDPLASPLLPPLGLTLAGLLSSCFLALLVGARGEWQRLRQSTLFVRWRTWLVIAPVFSLVVLAGPLPLALFSAALALQGSYEYAALARLTRSERGVLLGASVALPLTCLLAPLTMGMFLLPLVATLPSLLTQDAERGLTRVTRLAFGLFYLPVSLALLVVLDRAAGAGPGLVLSVALAVALSDVGAFTVGRLFGRRRLAAGLSPSKTWAGLVGNLAGAAVGLLLLNGLLPPTISLPLLALVVALGAVWGDLLESLLKRSAGVKDTGAWLPGFGGLLDRIDSLLMVLPLVYILVEVQR